MSFDSLGDLNWLAVVVATIAYFVLGALWYAPPVFGNAWMRAAGLSMEGDGPGPAIYIAPFIGSLVAVIATGMLTLATASDTASEGFTLGLVLAIGFAVTLIGVTAVFESTKPNAATWAMITAGYHSVGLVVAAVILAAWD